jgi:pimeloyl-ACP methyl ester carboxylesterase
LIRIWGLKMPVIKAGAFDLDYADTGAGPAVVLVHSSASGDHQWRRLIEALRSRYRLIAVNLFGYGKTSSWPGARPLNAADQAEFVATALARKPVALIGRSLGGVVAFEPILFGYLRAHGPAERL